MIQPSVFGQAIIIIVYLPILTLTGVEGKMFQPMALTVIFALVAAFVLSLTFVPAMVALCITGRVQEEENVLSGWPKRVYEPLVAGAAVRLRVRRSCSWPWLAFVGCASALSRAWDRNLSRRWTRRISRCTPCASRARR